MFGLLRRLGVLGAGQATAGPGAPGGEAGLRAQAEASLAAGDWLNVLALTRSPRHVAADVRLLMFRLSAARALEDRAVIEEVGLAAAALPMTVVMRRRIAHDLAAADMPEHAWRVLTSDPAAVADPRFLQSARAIKQKLTDRSLLAEVEAAIRGAGGETAALADSEHGFPESDVATPQGSVTLHPAPGVPQIHLDRLAADLAKFRDSQAKPAKPRVGVYENVFVDGVGQIWTEDGAILLSQGAPIPEVARAELEQIDLALHVSGRARGFYHWFVDRAPKLSWLLADGAPKPKLLLGEKEQGFERETLRLAGLDEADVVRGSRPVFVRRLLVAKVGLRAFPRWGRVAAIYERIVARALSEAEAPPPADRVYVSRRDSNRRRIANEEALEAAMEARGFKVCVLTGMPLAEQVALLARAKVIAGPHGAGLAHIVLARPGTTVIEILPICEGADTLRFNYARLAVARGLRHHVWVEAQAHAKAPWSVLLEGFLPVLDEVLATAD